MVLHNHVAVKKYDYLIKYPYTGLDNNAERKIFLSDIRGGLCL